MDSMLTASGRALVNTIAVHFTGHGTLSRAHKDGSIKCFLGGIGRTLTERSANAKGDWRNDFCYIKDVKVSE